MGRFRFKYQSHTEGKLKKKVPSVKTEPNRSLPLVITLLLFLLTLLILVWKSI